MGFFVSEMYSQTYTCATKVIRYHFMSSNNEKLRVSEERLHISVYCLRSCKPLNPSVRKYRVVKTSALISKFVRSRQAVHESGRSGWEHELFLQSQSDLTDVFCLQ